MTIGLPSEPLYLDDLAVGNEFISREHRLDVEQIIAFASELDPQPFHVEPERAQDTFFQGLVASGWHTMAITMRLIVENVPFAQGIIGAGAEVSWPEPTRPGEVLHVRSKVQEIRPSRSKPHMAIVLLHALTLNHDGNKRQDFTAKLLAFRRGA